MKIIKKEEGTLTVETALVLPIFILAVISIAYIMQALYTQSTIYSSMYSSVRELSVKAYDEDIDTADIENSVGKYSNVSMSNVNFLSSRYTKSNGLIEIVAKYNFSIPTLEYKFNQLKCEQHISMRGFTGDKNAKKSETIVFVTKTGKVYHTHIDCTYLLIKVKEVPLTDIETLRNSSGGKYYPCEKCIKDGVCEAEKVYISSYGTAYHEQATCSSIKRNITSVELSKVGGMSKCSKCSKRE